MATVETQQGLAKIFAMIGATVTTLTGAATLTLTTSDFEDDFKLIEDPGQDGNIETLLAYNRVINGTIDFIPNGGTRAAAIISLANSLPGMITKVTLASYALSYVNGDYNYIGGWSPKFTREGLVVCGIKLRAYLANRAALTAGVIVG